MITTFGQIEIGTTFNHPTSARHIQYVKITETSAIDVNTGKEVTIKSNEKVEVTK
jgi:hypothetical protein